jgi:hypothetical protein
LELQKRPARSRAFFVFETVPPKPA